MPCCTLDQIRAITCLDAVGAIVPMVFCPHLWTPSGRHLRQARPGDRTCRPYRHRILSFLSPSTERGKDPPCAFGPLLSNFQHIGAWSPLPRFPEPHQPDRGLVPPCAALRASYFGRVSVLGHSGGTTDGATSTVWSSSTRFCGGFLCGEAFASRIWGNQVDSQKNTGLHVRTFPHDECSADRYF